jgi:hypothetical protein
MIKNIFILAVLLMFSCGTKSTDSNGSDKSADSVTISGSNSLEDFNEFFKKFTTDSLFQVERVKFPWRLRLTTDEGETVEETSMEDWTFSTFYYEDSYGTREVDAYTQEIKINGDTATLQQRGVDNGIHVDYEFVMEKGKWILVSGKDFSD